jgi:carboxyl-terminal processing protease
MLDVADHASAHRRSPRRMTDQIPGEDTEPAAAPADSVPAAPAAPPVAPTAATAEASPLSPPPAPPAVPPGSRRSASRVPLALVLVLAPVFAVLVFAGGVLADRSGSLFASATAPTVAASSQPAGSPSADAASNLALIDQAWHAIQDNYVDAQHLDNKALAYAAIRSMTTAVGDAGHTSFMTAEESKASDQALSGSFVGIGVQVSTDAAGKVTVGSVIPGTPADQAGLRHGDHIVAVDGKATTGETVDQTVARVRGPEGQKVTLTIGRAGTPDFDVTITRRKFDLPLISWSMVPGRKVAMIRLEQFATGATKAVKDAITAAKAQGATSVILDLRSNPGGYVNEAVGVASQFVGDGIVYQAFDRSGTEKDSPVEPGGLWTNLPLVVLTNGDTASSAEIVTGAIQDAKRGQVVGEKTFGTGTVLGRFDLADGSALRIGTERWLTRGGRPIWHEGLAPDVAVSLPTTVQPLQPDAMREMTPAQLAASPDVQVLKALELLAAKG